MSYAIVDGYIDEQGFIIGTIIDGYVDGYADGYSYYDGSIDGYSYSGYAYLTSNRVSVDELKYDYKRFIESMRQSGTTAALVKSAKETGGYIIVANEEMKQKILKDHPELSGQIGTLYDISQRKFDNVAKGPIFFDTDAVMGLTNSSYTQKTSTEVNEAPKNQLNVKLNDQDIRNIVQINKDFFEEEASNSMLGRILIRKGIAFYNKLK